MNAYIFEYKIFVVSQAGAIKNATIGTTIQAGMHTCTHMHSLIQTLTPLS